MSKYLKILLVSTFLTTSLAACERVPVGTVGIKVNNFGGDKGVQDEVLAPGWYWVGFTKSLYTFPTFMQNYVWSKSPNEGRREDESISFQTKEGLSVSADIGISYQVIPEKVPVLFQTYRKGLQEITDIYLRNIVRDALVTKASLQPIEAIYGSGKTELITEVQKEVSDKVKPVGIQIDQLSWVGELRLPQTVTESINAKIQATQIAQQKENEVAAAKAEAQKLVVAAQAQAESLRLQKEQITPAMIEFRKVENQKTAIEKWNGKLPEYMMGGGALPFINIPGASYSAPITAAK